MPDAFVYDAVRWDAGGAVELDEACAVQGMRKVEPEILAVVLENVAEGIR